MTLPKLDNDRFVPKQGLRTIVQVDGFVQRLAAEVGLQRVRYRPRQYLACEPVHDRHE